MAPSEPLLEYSPSDPSKTETERSCSKLAEAWDSDKDWCSRQTQVNLQCIPAHVGSATLFGATTNIVLAVLGAGQLTLPYAMKELGWIFGLGTFSVFTLLTTHSLHTMSVYSRHFKPKHSDCIDSYAEQVVRVLNAPGKFICVALLAIYAWGGALSFLVILKGELGYLARVVGFDGGMGCPLMIAVATFVIWPLSSLEDVSMLKKVSPLGCAAAIFITVVVLLCTPWNGDVPFGVESCSGPSNIEGAMDAGTLQRWPKSFLSIAATVPLLSFALNATWAYVPVLCTLETRTPARVTSLIGGSMFVIVSNYLFIAIYGYATFCGAVKPNILDSLGDWVPFASFQGKMVLLAKAMLSVQLTLALPMRFFVARKSVFGEAMAPSTRWFVSGLSVFCAAALAVLPLPLNAVMGVTSSICASMIIYILPAVIDLKLQLPGLARKMLSAVSLPIGIFVLLAGTAANVMGVAVGL